MSQESDPVEPVRSVVAKRPWILRALLVVMFFVVTTIFVRMVSRGQFTLGDRDSKMLVSREESPTLFWVFVGFGALGPIIMGTMVIQSFVQKKEPIQAPQRNAGSRPSSDDSPASETPSSLGPRG